MPAVRKNLVIEQGATFKFTISWMLAEGSAPVDITGYTARMHIRDNIDAVDPALVELTTENLRITLGGTSGTIQLSLSAVDTAAITFTEGVYDLELVNTGGTGDVTRLTYGGVEVRPEVTR